MALKLASKKAESILIWTDTVAIIRDKEKIHNAPKKWMELIDESIDYLGRPLTEEEKWEILQRRWPAIVDILRRELGFPKATEESITGLHGRDYEEIRRELNNADALLKLSDYEFIEGQLKPTQVALDAIVERYTYRTSTPEQNERYHRPKPLADAFNDCIQAGDLVVHTGGYVSMHVITVSNLAKPFRCLTVRNDKAYPYYHWVLYGNN